MWTAALLIAQVVAPATAAPVSLVGRCAAIAASDLGPAALYRAGNFASAHHLALALRTFCVDEPVSGAAGLVAALALARLEDSAGARSLLTELARTGSGPAAERATVALAWLALRNKDTQAFGVALARLPPAPAARMSVLAALDDAERFPAETPKLDLSLGVRVRAARQEREAARRLRRPWAAALLSAVLPGAGQVYAGSWQSAALSFSLNAIFSAAAVELFRKRLYFTGTATAVVTSVFYVGSIVNAADLARRQNEAAALPASERLESLLVPEIHP